MSKKLNFSSIGAHVSMAGGLDKAVERVWAIGGNCMQIFSGSPRSWSRSLPTSQMIKKLYTKQEELGVKSIFTHALYLVNLVSPKPELLEQSINSIIFDLKFDSLIKGLGVVVHLGSHQGRGWDAVKDDLVLTIQKILKQTPSDSFLLIENSAGQKGKLASNLEEIKWLLTMLNSLRVGWCVDTCHAFAAGFPLVSSSQYCDKKHPDLISEIKRIGLGSTLRCIHVNDSRVAFAAGNDMHDNIGEGLIPQEDMKMFLRDPLVANIPLITEAPGFDNKGPDKENINRLKRLAGVKE